MEVNKNNDGIYTPDKALDGTKMKDDKLGMSLDRDYLKKKYDHISLEFMNMKEEISKSSSSKGKKSILPFERRRSSQRDSNTNENESLAGSEDKALEKKLQKIEENLELLEQNQEDDQITKIKKKPGNYRSANNMIEIESPS